MTRLNCILYLLFVVSTPISLAADSETRRAQEKLSSLGFYYDKVDGEKGPETEAAICRFQIRNGLAVTGTLNEETTVRLYGAAPKSLAGRTPAPAPTSVVESDRAFLNNDARKPTPPVRQVEEPPIENRPQTQPIAPPPSPEPEPIESRTDLAQLLDAFFAGTPFENADAGTQQEVLIRAQAQLRRFRYYYGEIDGIPGNQTVRAIVSLQDDEYLRRTGRLDADTLETLGIVRSRRSDWDAFFGVPPPPPLPRPVYRGRWVQ